jgi:hypothetical protein
MDVLQDLINQDLARGEHDIARLKDSVVMAHTGLQDANEARSQMLADRHLALEARQQ